MGEGGGDDGSPSVPFLFLNSVNQVINICVVSETAKASYESYTMNQLFFGGFANVVIQVCNSRHCNIIA